LLVGQASTHTFTSKNLLILEGLHVKQFVALVTHVWQFVLQGKHDSPDWKNPSEHEVTHDLTCNNFEDVQLLQSIADPSHVAQLGSQPTHWLACAKKPVGQVTKH